MCLILRLSLQQTTEIIAHWSILSIYTVYTGFEEEIDGDYSIQGSSIYDTKSTVWVYLS